jgi:hypothetical protein
MIVKNYCKKWTAKENEFLLANSGKLLNLRIAQLLNRTPCAVHSQRHKLKKEKVEGKISLLN